MDNSNDHKLDITPSTELRFKGPFTQVVTSHLKLKNSGSKVLCYKVKTTAPKMYCVRPNSGLIEVGKEVEVSIMLQPFEYSASDKVRHKFLIQSAVADENNLEHSEQLWKTLEKEMIREIKLKCSFDPEQTSGDLIMEDAIVPSKNVSNNAQPGSEMASAYDLKKQLEELKTENERLKASDVRLRKIALQDTLDHNVMPVISHDLKHVSSNNTRLMIILSFIAFFIGILVARFIL